MFAKRHIRMFKVGAIIGLLILFLDWYIPSRGCVFGIESYIASWGCWYQYLLHPISTGHLVQALAATNFGYLSYLVYLVEIILSGIIVALTAATLRKKGIRIYSYKGVLISLSILSLFIVSPYIRYYPAFAYISSATYCKHLTSASQQSSCWLHHATEHRSTPTAFKSDLAYCDNIENVESRKYCYRTRAISALQNSNDLATCDVLSNPYDKGECYAIYAEQNNEVDVCYHIENYLALDRCIGYFTYQYMQYTPPSPDRTICDRVDSTYVTVKNSCYFRMITDGKLYDPTMCDNVVDYPGSDIYEPEYCLSLVARGT